MPHGEDKIKDWLYPTGVLVLMAFVAAGTLQSGLLLRRWTPPFNLLLSLPDNALRLALIGLCVFWGWRMGPGPAALGWGTTALPAELAFGAGVGLLTAAAINLGSLLVVRRWGQEAFSTRLIQCILPLDSREWLGVLLALLPAAAVEELLFRSLPLGGPGLFGVGGLRPHWLMWPLALFFGLLHWPQGGWGVVGTTLAAIILSLLFLVTGSLWPPLAAHYVLNVSQIVVAKWMGMEAVRGA
ncbi:MAG: CPBP family intramembrane metalloprotease [Chloroflexi bacterium]|nr:CPBP family intramembrane metalloprotease [Chloroflexota bacterium]